MSEARFSPYTTLASFEVVEHYYSSLYDGNLDVIKELMTKDSYFMTLESFGLKLAFRDKEFKEKLSRIKKDADALAWVEERLSSDLASRNPKPKVNIDSIEWNGQARQTVNYSENGESKKLYLSKEDGGWKINYYAGRKVS